MRSIDQAFYRSKAWRDCRAAYIKSVGGLCERCLSKGLYKAGVIVHHKTYLNADNYTDPQWALCHENLELLCRDCHNTEHTAREKRYKVDFDGSVTVI